jgi:hypothetical protein
MTLLINLYNKLARLLHLKEVMVFVALDRHGKGSIYSSELMTDYDLRKQVLKLIRQSTWTFDAISFNESEERRKV